MSARMGDALMAGAWPNTSFNAGMAYARAWSLRQQVMLGDRCGSYDLLEPKLTAITHAERGGEYRGVRLRAVMKRK